MNSSPRRPRNTGATISPSADRANPYRRARITGDKIDRILINFMLPFMFDRLRRTEGEECAAEVVEMFDSIDGEHNNIVGRYDAHISVRTSFDSQALIQLYKCYCRQNRCWQCPVGARYMSSAR